MFEAALSALDVEVDLDAVEDAACLEAIRELEQAKCLAEARQAEITAHLTHRTADRKRLAQQVAAARRESPHRARQHVGLALVLPELPHTAAAFRAGKVSEWRTTLVARETACLTLEHRQSIDRELAGDADHLEAMGDNEIVKAVRRRAAALDAASVVARRRRAEADRNVTCRPAPDTMTYLTVLTTVEQGVAAYAALSRAADTARATGDPRSRGQVMADTLIERITGQTPAPDVPVAVNLVLSDQTLLGDSDEPAHLDGHGPLPADLARAWITHATRKTLRRLYASPTTGQLVAMDSRRRTFPQGLADLIRFRDQTCRTPWCDAPIRHTDHITPATDGGVTSFTNGQGLCEACNQTKGSTSTTDRTTRPPPAAPRPWDLRSPPDYFFVLLPAA